MDPWQSNALLRTCVSLFGPEPARFFPDSEIRLPIVLSLWQSNGEALLQNPWASTTRRDLKQNNLYELEKFLCRLTRRVVFFPGDRIQISIPVSLCQSSGKAEQFCCFFLTVRCATRIMNPRVVSFVRHKLAQDPNADARVREPRQLDTHFSVSLP
jgi:hypothetical protein